MLTHLLLLTLFLLAHPPCTDAFPPMGPRRRPIIQKPDGRDRVFKPDEQLKANLARDPADRKPAFLQMPMSRKTFSGTGKRNGRGGRYAGGGPTVVNASRDARGGAKGPLGFKFEEGSIECEGERTTAPVWAARGGRPPPPGKGAGGPKGRPSDGSEVPRGPEWWFKDVADDVPVPSATNTEGALTATRTETSLERRQTNTYGYDWGWAHLWDLGGIAYTIALDIGTPPQQVRLIIDTGSYETWVNPRCDKAASVEICNDNGHYYWENSTTASFQANGFHVAYGTGEAVGWYFNDIIRIAMFVIPDVQFAVATDTDYTFTGIMALGYAAAPFVPFPPILEWLNHLRLINAKIFSIGLGSHGDEFCEIIFGGVNRWKFAGYLEPVPIWPPVKEQPPYHIQYWVNVTSVGMTKDGEKPFVWTRRDAFNMPCMFDTGSTLSYIREDLVAAIGQQFNAWVEGAKTYRVDCAWKEKKGTVDFGFNKGRMVINVSYRDFIWEMFEGNCLLGVQPADASATTFLLGNTFIRAAYMVFDQQSDIIWMSQYYNCGDGVVTVGINPMDIEGIRGAC